MVNAVCIPSHIIFE